MCSFMGRASLLRCRGATESRGQMRLEGRGGERQHSRLLEIEGLDDLPGEGHGAFSGVMDVGFALDFGGVLEGERIEVVDFNSLILHDLGGNFVVFRGVAGDSPAGTCGHRGGIAPNQARSGFFEACDEVAKVFLVCGGRDLLPAALAFGRDDTVSVGADVFQIVKAPVEVDDVPLFLIAADFEPLFKLGQSFDRGPAIGGRAMHVGLALQEFAHLEGVSHRDGIADEKNAGEPFNVFDLHQGTFWRGGRNGLDEGEEEEKGLLHG